MSSTSRSEYVSIPDVEGEEAVVEVEGGSSEKFLYNRFLLGLFVLSAAFIVICSQVIWVEEA